MRTERQSSTEKVHYAIDFGDRLDECDYITGVTWTASGMTTSDSDFTPSYAEIVATGGTVGTEYTLQAVVDTALGRKHEKTIAVLVVER